MADKSELRDVQTLQMHQDASIVVVGAGIAGLCCAQTLAAHGFRVTVVDKARSPGGRMSTRRTEHGFGFDHGCQYFSPKGEPFKRVVETWCNAGVVKQWHGRVVIVCSSRMTDCVDATRYVGVPGMNSICNNLASRLDIRTGVRVEAVVRRDNGSQILDSSGSSSTEDLAGETFDAVVVAIPATQAVALLDETSQLAEFARSVRFSPCWTVMMAFEPKLEFEADAAHIEGSALSWICRNSSKPQRKQDGDCWVVQADADWSTNHIDRSREWIENELLDSLSAILQQPEIVPVHKQAHLWRYAIPSQSLHDGFAFDPVRQIGICGDWCAGSRVESAFLSGIGLADRIIDLTVNAD